MESVGLFYIVRFSYKRKMVLLKKRKFSISLLEKKADLLYNGLTLGFYFQFGK